MSYISIAGRKIGKDYPPFVIAEAGINHEGSFDKAIQLVDSAFSAGAECIKFQCHVIDDEMTNDAKYTIPGNTDVSIYDLMGRCKLSFEDEVKLKEYAESKGLIYLSTPFSRAAANFLNDIGVHAFKIGSGECNNYPLIEHIARFGKPVILSTGMNNFTSIDRAVDILKKHYVEHALLHCTSIYPTPYELIGLPIISSLMDRYGCVVGVSDHSRSIYPLLGSVSLGARILERHFTVSMDWDGPDIEVSMDPTELERLIEGSKAIFYSCQRLTNEILPEELSTINFAYSSVVSVKEIKTGSKFTADNIWVKRPGTGDFLAKDYEMLIGKTAAVDITSGVQIKTNMVK